MDGWREREAYTSRVCIELANLFDSGDFREDCESGVSLCCEIDDEITEVLNLYGLNRMHDIFMCCDLVAQRGFIYH